MMKYSILTCSVLSALRTILLAIICAVSLTSFAASVDINTASVEQISSSLKGIGPAKAQAIVTYRTENGPFVSVDQLAEVKGIGSATVDKLRDSVLISKPESKAKK